MGSGYWVGALAGRVLVCNVLACTLSGIGKEHAHNGARAACKEFSLRGMNIHEKREKTANLRRHNSSQEETRNEVSRNVRDVLK